MSLAMLVMLPGMPLPFMTGPITSTGKMVWTPDAAAGAHASARRRVGEGMQTEQGLRTASDMPFFLQKSHAARSALVLAFT